MIERVVSVITRYSMFRQGQRVGVAVSGGADSVCLLHILRELAPRWDLRLSVLHLDHGLRGEESQADAQFVRDLAAQLGFPMHCQEADVGRICRETGDNLEQAARRVRHDFYRRFLEGGDMDRVALGHTRSDQAETVLYRFLRGAGTAGLAGIRPVTSDGLVRPLIDVGREEVEQYLRDRHLEWRNDSTNRSLEFARNRIRHELLPMLVREWNQSLPEILARMADWALEEEAYWEGEMVNLSAAHLTRKTPAVLLRAGRLRELPRAVARRLARRAVELVKGDLRSVSFQHIDSFLALASSGQGHGRIQLPGVDIFRSFDWIRVAPPGLDNLENRNFGFPLPVPGRVVIPGERSRMLTEVVENSMDLESLVSGYNEMVDCIDWERISTALEVRNWRPGDQYRPVGHTAEQKVKTLFHEARVPLWERRSWPVVTSGETIVWTRRFGPAASYAAGSSSGLILRIREVPGDCGNPSDCSRRL